MNRSTQPSGRGWALTLADSDGFIFLDGFLRLGWIGGTDRDEVVGTDWYPPERNDEEEEIVPPPRIQTGSSGITGY